MSSLSSLSLNSKMFLNIETNLSAHVQCYVNRICHYRLIGIMDVNNLYT